MPNWRTGGTYSGVAHGILGSWVISDAGRCSSGMYYYFQVHRKLLSNSCLTLHSSSGFNSESRRNHDEHSHNALSVPVPRRNPYDFTGCIAHAEITERDSDGQVARIVGVLDHNEGCQSAQMARLPSIPLHPHVYEVALDQLRSGAR